MSGHRPKLAICAIFKDEGRFLLEWIAYHVAVGVEHFVLYDNDSTDGGTALVRGSPLADKVTIIHWPQRPGQLSAYRHFIDIFAPGFEWAAFIDLDEFLLPLGGGRVTDTLDRLDTAAAVLVHWRVFGPGEWTERPPGLVIENYDRRAPDEFDMNRHVKSVVRCAELIDVTHNPHEFILRGQVFNTAGRPVPNIAIQDKACHERLVINHYHTRSRTDWAAKVARGNAMFDQSAPAYDPALIEHFAAVCVHQDHIIRAFVPAVQKLLGTTPNAAATEAPTAATLASAAPAVSPPAPPPAPREEHPPVQAAPGWVWYGPDAQQHAAALVFCDASRPKHPWQAALRGGGAASVDPDFVVDEYGRIRDFDSDAEARAACADQLGLRGRPI